MEKTTSKRQALQETPAPTVRAYTFGQLCEHEGKSKTTMQRHRSRYARVEIVGRTGKTTVRYLSAADTQAITDARTC